MAKVLSELDAAEVIAKGVGRVDLERWPLVALPEFMAWEAESREADHANRPVMFGPIAPVRGLKLPWGVITLRREDAPHVGPGYEVLQLDGYLDEDRFVELRHLRKGAETVGVWLSDLVAADLSRGAGERTLRALSALGFEFDDDTDHIGQVFGFFGVGKADHPLPDEALAAMLSRWMRIASVADSIERVQRPESIRRIRWESNLPIYTFAPVH